MKRSAWVDSTRFFAIFVIMVTHFLAKASPQTLSLWEEPPTSYLLSGLTGKLSVAFFCVLLGYFAAKPRDFSVRSLARYTLRRYVQFSFYILLVSVIHVVASYGATWVFHAPDDNAYRVISDGFKYNLIYVLRDSFLFECTYNDALWGMGQFFISSIICFLLGSLMKDKRPAPRFAVAAVAMILLLLTGRTYFTWIAVCILGYVLRLCVELQDCRPAPSAPWLVVLFLAAVCLIKAPLQEGVALYFMEGLGSLLLLIVMFRLPRLQALFSRGPFPWLGKISIGLFIAETPTNSLLHSTLYPLLSAALPRTPMLIIYFAAYVTMTVLFAWLLDICYARVSRVLFREKTLTGA